MLRRDAGKSVSICDGFRKRYFLHMGRGFLPLLAVMLLATPQLAFANGPTVTVRPSSLDIGEPETGTNEGSYEISLDESPTEAVKITVHGASHVDSRDGVVGGIGVLSTGEAQNEATGLLELAWAANALGADLSKTVTVRVYADPDAVDEQITLTHTAVIGSDPNPVTLRNSDVTVTVTDADERSVTISKPSLTFMEAESETFTVTLSSQPTAIVTVDVGGASGEITVSPSRLFFTPDDYGEETVTVFAGEDFDADDDHTTLTYTVRGGDYTGVAPSPLTTPVRVTDNDKGRRGITVVPASLVIPKGRSATYTIVLDTQPKRNVKINVIVPDDATGIRVTRTSLTFSASRWDSPQSVTVSADSGTADRPTISGTTIRHMIDAEGTTDESYDDPDSVDISADTVGITTVDDPPTRLSVRSSLPVAEGGRTTYTVKPYNRPTVADGAITVTVAGDGAGTDLVVDTTPDDDPITSTLTFTNADYAAKTVRVIASEDQDAVNDVVVLTHTVSGDASNLISATTTVTITDNDTQGVTVSRPSLEVAENGTGTYTVNLDTKPVGDEKGRVTVTITGASGDVTVNPSQLTFFAAPAENEAPWHEAQPITVRAAPDDDAEIDSAVTLRHTVRGGDYEGLRGVDSVKVTIRESQTKGITVNPSELTVPEGDSLTYTVRLDSMPTGTVTVMVRGASGDVTVRPSRLTFTTSTWDEEQEVKVSAAQDGDAEPDASVTLTHFASRGGYDRVFGGTVTVTVQEDDTQDKRILITPRALDVREGLEAKTYSVELNTKPTGTVTVRLTAESITAAKAQSLDVRPTTMRFSPRNWNVPQVVTVRAEEDDDGTAAPVTLDHVSTGGRYDFTAEDDELPSVSVSIKDNDSPGLRVTPQLLEIVAGKSQTYSVVLNTKPAGPVTVDVSPTRDDISAKPDQLVFDGLNWSSPRTVTVHVNDGVGEGSATVTNGVSSTGTGGDPIYDAPTEVPDVDVMVTIKASDSPGVAVNPTSLTITEGESDSYSVVLAKLPTKTVAVAVETIPESREVRLDRTRLSFTVGNWNKEQTVKVSLSEDDDAATDGTVTLVHKVTGAPEYEELPPADVTSVRLTFVDNDTRGVTVSPTSLTIGAGGSGTYRVRLNTQPSAITTVRVKDIPEEVTVDPTSLEFTTSNWGRDQTVTVTVDKDAGGDEEQTVTLSHEASGSDYKGVGISRVTVSIPVEGVPGAPTGLTASAGDQRVTLRWSAPSRDGGSAITRYEYRYREEDGSYGGWTTISGGASATSTTVSGLDNGTTYEFQVRARNDIGPGPESNTASATLAESAPGAPSGLTATGGDEQVTLNWSAPEDGGSQIIRYEYHYAAVGESYGEWERVDGGGSARRVSIPNLTNGTEYRFQVRAVNAIDAGEASQTSATPGRAPSAPMRLTARSESEAIIVTWGAPADNGGSAIRRFEVLYRMSGEQGGNWMTVDGGASATSYTITDLTNGVGYEIQVRAVNAIGNGAVATTEATPMEGLVFAHFANGKSGDMTNISDLVLVNVETSTVNSAIYFYNKEGVIIPADSLVDMTGDLEDTGDGGVTVSIVGQGEMTVSTNGEGKLETGSVKVFSTGRIGGVLRYDISMIGVAGVGASAPVSDAIFPVRRTESGINTGVAIRNLGSETTKVTCHLMQGGRRLSGRGVSGDLEADGQRALFIDQMFPNAIASDFSGSVRCMAAEGGMFTAVALEMDAANQIFTTLPVVPVDAAAADDGMSMLNFAHFANGDFNGNPIISDLVFVNVANTAVAPVIYFYDQDGNMIDADTVVDAMMEGVDFAEDGALTVMTQIPPLGEMTISTSVMGDDVVGSVRVDSDGPIGGVLRFVTSNIGVAGVGASEAVNAAIFPARYMEGGINTGAAIRNLESERMTVNCKLMQGGRMVDEEDIPLAANAQNSQFITEVFDEIMDSGMSEFVGSVHCSAPEGMMFTGVALEMDFINRVFTTLPVVPVR